ncbi:MAG: methyltransferase [Bacteroidota bacterium]
MSNSEPFRFKQFEIQQEKCAMKVGTDGVLLGAWADVEGAKTILDIGTGSGVIAIMLGQRNKEAMIHGVEIDASSCEQTELNMKNAPWADRLKSFHMSIQDYAKVSNTQYDLIVSNPPFFSGGTISENQDRNSVRHTVKMPHGDLLIAVRRLLTANGKFCVVLPYIEGLRFRELAATYNLYCTRSTEVKPKASKGIERLLLQFENTKKEEQVDELVIQKEEGRNVWTEEYIALTGMFYLKM